LISQQPNYLKKKNQLIDFARTQFLKSGCPEFDFSTTHFLKTAPAYFLKK